MTELHAALGTTGVPLRLRRPPTFTPKPNWHRYMHVAATFALVVAIATAGFFAIREQSGTPASTEVPEVVLGLASPDSDNVVMREPREPIPGFGAIERDMPILVSQVDSLSESADWFSFNSTSSWYQIRFDDERGFAELEVRNNAEIRHTFYPNIFLAYVPGGVHVVNISSLSAITIQTDVSADRLEDVNAPLRESQWMVIPDTNLVVNMQTMSVFALNEVLGITSDRFSPYLAVTNESGSNLIIAIDVIDDPDNRWRLAKLSSDGTAVTIPVSDPLPSQLGLALSPDGEHAVVRSSRVENNKAVDVFTVIELSTGEVTAKYEHPGDLRTSDPVWVDEGSAFVYSNHGVLYRADLDNLDPNPLYEAKGTQLSIYKTGDPDTVVLVQNLSNTSPDPVEMDDPRQIIVVNVESGETSVHQGSDQTMPSDPDTTYIRNAAMVEENPAISSIHELDVSVIDTTTGEEVGTIERPASDTARPGPVKSAWGTATGDIQFVTWGSQHTYKVIDNDGEAMLKRITPPPGPASENDLGVTIRSSDDSGWLAMHVDATGEWWIADITGPEPEWELLPSFQQIIFVTANESQSNAVALAPAASPIASATCDFSTDTPLIMGAESTPTEGTTLLITPAGEMKLVCGDNETTLATNVDLAIPTSVPNVVMVETSDGMRIVNIATGDSLEFPYGIMTVLQNPNLSSTWGSWMLVPSSSDETLVSLIDLRTLTEVPVTISDDHPVQESAIAGFSVNATDTHAVVAVSFNHSSTSRYLQGFFIANAEGEHRFVHTQADVLPRTIAISPDGETIATSWYQGTMESGETNISLYSTTDGELIESWQLRTGDIQTEITWLDDGSGLVFTDGNALYLIDADHPGDGFLVLYEGEQVSGIVLTPDSNVVAVSSTAPQEQGRPVSQTAIVNIVTGEVVLLDGRDLWAESFGPASQRSVLVLADFFGSHNQDSLTMTVVDAVTGEVIDEIEHNPQAQMSISNATSALPRGNVNLFAMGPDTVWQLLDANGQPSVKEISLPVPRDSLNSDELLISMNGNGRIGLTFFDPFSTWMWIPNGDDGEWLEIDAEMPDNDLGLPVVVMFIRGED